MTSGGLFIGDTILTVNGVDLGGRSIAQVVEAYHTPTFTLELAPRELESAVLAFSRASLTQLRQLVTYLKCARPGRVHALQRPFCAT